MKETKWTSQKVEYKHGGRGKIGTDKTKTSSHITRYETTNSNNCNYTYKCGCGCGCGMCKIGPNVNCTDVFLFLTQ